MNWWMGKENGNRHTMKYYSDFKDNKFLPYVTIRTKLEDIMLSKLIQS